MSQIRNMKRRKHRENFVERIESFSNYEKYLDPERGLTKERCWSYCNNMTSRCYNENFHKTHPEYLDCEMCPEWRMSRENIVRWIYENWYIIPDETMSIDKDLRFPGNKIYSPETCIILPMSINTFFTPERKLERDLPPGVYQKNKNGYYTLWRENGKQIYIPYDSIEEAREAYLTHKEEQRDQMIEIYQEKGLPTEILELIKDYDIRNNF